MKRASLLLALLVALRAGAQEDPDPRTMMEEMPATDRWTGMLHGYAFLTGNRQGGPSGDRVFESQNHLMAMALRSFAGGKLSLLGTFTLEPATIPVEGSPELFQRGETYRGLLLVDRQHPHDLFVQLAVAWERALARDLSLRVYLAPLGEPALGPVAFPHRLSASENPTAPLSHHVQDSTHIAADVATLGATWRWLTLEGSLFHGAEPDENRWDVEQGRLDSRSVRLRARPAEGLELQVSTAHLTEPEAVEEGDQTRTTASASYTRPFEGGFLALSAIVGKNRTHDGPEWGKLLEGTFRFAEKNALFARWEQVDRDAEELLRKEQRPEELPRRRVAIDAFTLGGVRDFQLAPKLQTGIGADVTFYTFPSFLREAYGRNPVSFHVFLRVRFERHLGHAAHAHDAPDAHEEPETPQTPPAPRKPDRPAPPAGHDGHGDH